MQKKQGKIIELQPGRTLFKKGEIYSHFYELISGEIELLLGAFSFNLREGTFFGDFEIISDIQSRASTAKAYTKCLKQTKETDRFEKGYF